MLVQTDSAELGDRRLNPEEVVIREREALLREASRSKIHGQEELEDAERSAGPRLYYTEIIRRLRNINSDLQVLEGSPGNVALYKRKHRGEYDGSEVDDKRPAPSGFHADFFKDHTYVGGMVKDWLPEFSHVILDTSNLPVREYRGWRSVIIGLIKQGVLTYAAAVREFGEPTGPRAGRWSEQLQPYRYRV